MKNLPPIPKPPQNRLVKSGGSETIFLLLPIFLVLFILLF